MGTKGQLMIYKHRGGGGATDAYTQAQPYGSDKQFFAIDKVLIIKYGKVISAPVRTRE